MASSYYREKLDIGSVSRRYGLTDENIINLILKNITDVDKKIYTKFPIGVTKQNMLKNAPFTEQFLILIDQAIKDKSEYERMIFYSLIGNFLKNYNPVLNKEQALDIYEPANRIQFLFLANVYCHSKRYFEMYKDWLPNLLFSFEEAGFTGEFKIKKNVYNTLFGDCHTAGSIKSDLPFFYKENDADNKPIYDWNLKTLSNTSLKEQVFKSDDPAVGWDKSKAKEIERQASISRKRRLDELEEETETDIPECPYGDSCYRKNPQHLSEYRHLHPVKKRAHTIRSSLGEDAYAGGKKTRKHKPKRTTKKRNKTKRTTKKRTTKKHSKNKRKQI
jgi:hypothetical protein